MAVCVSSSSHLNFTVDDSLDTEVDMSAASTATREPPVWTDDRITAVLFLLDDTQYGYSPSTVAVVRELMPQVGALFEHGMVVSRAPYTVCWPGLSLLIPLVFRVARPTALTFFLVLSFSLSLSIPRPPPSSSSQLKVPPVRKGTKVTSAEKLASKISSVRKLWLAEEVSFEKGQRTGAAPAASLRDDLCRDLFFVSNYFILFFSFFLEIIVYLFTVTVYCPT